MTAHEGTVDTRSATISQRVQAFLSALNHYWQSPLFMGIGPDGPEAPEWHTVGEDDYPAVREAVLRLANTARSLAKAVANTHNICPLLDLADELEHGESVIGRSVEDCYPPTKGAKRLANAIALREEVNAQIKSEKAAEQQASVPLDVVEDPHCVILRDILRAGPKMLAAIEKDPRCPSRRRASGLLKAMALRGMVAQTKTRGPWRLVSDTPMN